MILAQKIVLLGKDKNVWGVPRIFGIQPPSRNLEFVAIKGRGFFEEKKMKDSPTQPGFSPLTPFPQAGYCTWSPPRCPTLKQTLPSTTQAVDARHMQVAGSRGEVPLDEEPIPFAVVFRSGGGRGVGCEDGSVHACMRPGRARNALSWSIGRVAPTCHLTGWPVPDNFLS